MTNRQREYLSDFQQQARMSFSSEAGQEKHSGSFEEATYRWAHAMAGLGVLMAEATELPRLKQFAGVYPKLLLPFPGIEEKYTGPDSVPAKIPPIIQEFQCRPMRFIEAEYREMLLNPLLRAIFEEKGSLAYKTEFNLTLMHLSYPDRDIDMAFCLDNIPALGVVPLVLIEVSRDPMDPVQVHKDELKLAAAMWASLREQFTIHSHLGDAHCATLRVFGILIGVTEFEVSVIYPDYEAASPGDPARILSFVYRSSKRNWRFPLFYNEGERPEFSPENGFCCLLEDAFAMILPSGEFTDQGGKQPAQTAVDKAEIRLTFAVEMSKVETDRFAEIIMQTREAHLLDPPQQVEASAPISPPVPTLASIPASTQRMTRSLSRIASSSTASTNVAPILVATTAHALAYTF